MNKLVMNALKGKTSEKVPKSQWTYWYDEIIPNEDWDMLEVTEKEKISTQVYKKDNEIIMFEFNLKGDDEIYGLGELTDVIRWTDRKGVYNMKKDFEYENEDGIGININPELIDCIKKLYKLLNGDKERMNEMRDICVNQISKIIINNSENASEIISRHFEIAMEDYEKENNI